MSTDQMPTLFVSHGAPSMVLEEGGAALALRQAGERLPRPTAIVAVSAHWIAPMPTVSTAAMPSTIHDFRGFPRSLYEMQYPAPGAPLVAQQVGALLEAQGMPVAYDANRGMDHGVWSPLTLLFPQADIPVTCLALDASLDPTLHFRIGEGLRPLRDRGVLIVASGSATHNLGEVDLDDQEAPDWAVAFDQWLKGRVEQGDTAALIDWMRQAPQPLMAHPTPEHYIPLLVAMGAAGDGSVAERIVDQFAWGSLSLASWSFGPPVYC